MGPRFYMSGMSLQATRDMTDNAAIEAYDNDHHNEIIFSSQVVNSDTHFTAK